MPRRRFPGSGSAAPRALVRAGRLVSGDVVDGGTMVVINGPRFSTRAESAWFRSMGWHVVNMTGYPEAVLAAELGIGYATIALVTDYDAGVDGHPPVTMERVFAMLQHGPSERGHSLDDRAALRRVVTQR